MAPGIPFAVTDVQSSDELAHVGESSERHDVRDFRAVAAVGVTSGVVDERRRTFDYQTLQYMAPLTS
jgi:hypothetical protein